MLRKMSFGAMAALAVSMSSVAFGQTTTTTTTTQTTTTTTTVDTQNFSVDRHWNSAEWNPIMARDMASRYTGDQGTFWSHAMMSLNSAEQYTLQDMFRRLPGSDEHILMKAIVGAMEKNAGTYMTNWQRGDYTNMNAGSNTNPSNTTGTANQPMLTSMGAYPREWELRPVGSMEAYDLLVGALDDTERGALRNFWPTLQVKEQDAILKMIKESPRVHAAIIRYDIWNTPFVSHLSGG